MAQELERYGVYWVNLDPVLGAGTAKTRPAVVISDGAMNASLPTVVVCPVTSRLHPRWPFRVPVTLGETFGEVAVDQLRTVDRSRLGDLAGRLPGVKAEELRHIVTLMYGVLAK